ncbi:MAG: DUF481 domain-containing protein [Bacteroidetes bacterium]|nr:MAG: DUF481 domain-containing protein [Bacteroidota bacterium]
MQKQIFPVLLAFLLLAPALVHAQIVNIEDKRISKTDTSGVFGNLDLGANWVENGKTVLTLRGSGRIDFLRKKHLFFSLTNFNLVKVESNEFVNDGFEHLRYNYVTDKKWTYEAFLQAQYNERIRLKFRGLAGTGARFEWLKKADHRAYFGAAYMFEYEKIRDTSLTHRNHRLSTYLSFQFRPLKNLTFSGTTYYQPLFADFGDFRLSSQTAASLKITDRLSFQVTFNLQYDARLKEDAPNIPATSYALVNGLRWAF